MDQKQVYNSINDVYASQKDFVVEHQDILMFAQNYELDSVVIGSGAFGKV